MGQAGALTSLVEIAAERGGHEQAFSLTRASIELLVSIRSVSGRFDTLNVCRRVARRCGGVGTGGTSLGCAARLGPGARVVSGIILSTSRRATSSSTASATALGDEAFERAWEQGSRMSPDEAVANALETLGED